jgi:hypothetical protein
MAEAFGTTFASGRDRGGLVGRRELLAVLRDHPRPDHRGSGDGEEGPARASRSKTPRPEPAVLG